MTHNSACVLIILNLKGGDCDKFLKEENLQGVEKLSGFTPDLQIFVDTFRDFRAVIRSCFGFTLAEDWEEAITKFRSTYLAMKRQHGVSVSLKFHHAFFHVRHAIHQKGRALGEYR